MTLALVVFESHCVYAKKKHITKKTFPYNIAVKQFLVIIYLKGVTYRLLKTKRKPKI